MERFYIKLVYIFLTALGMILGGTLIGSISATLFGFGPLRVMSKLAKDLKIWAAVAAIGGSFSSLQALETGILEGQMRLVIKQLGFMVSAFAGAHVGYLIIVALSNTNK
jgi:hypothetical protein